MVTTSKDASASNYGNLDALANNYGNLDASANTGVQTVTLCLFGLCRQQAKQAQNLCLGSANRNAQGGRYWV